MKYFSFFLFLLSILFFTTCQNVEETTNEQEVGNSGESKAQTISSELVQPIAYSMEQLNKLGIDTTQVIPQGLQPGKAAPAFRGIDQNGKTVSLKEELRKGSVVIVFYRGYWCGICKRHLSNFSDSLELVRAKGASVIAIAPEVAENTRKTIGETGFEVPIISDQDGAIMKAYGVKFHANQNYQDRVLKYTEKGLPEINGMDDSVLPVPATYIIAPTGKITYAHFDPDYRKRVSVNELLSAL